MGLKNSGSTTLSLMRFWCVDNFSTGNVSMRRREKLELLQTAVLATIQSCIHGLHMLTTPRTDQKRPFRCERSPSAQTASFVETVQNVVRYSLSSGVLLITQQFTIVRAPVRFHRSSFSTSNGEVDRRQQGRPDVLGHQLYEQQRVGYTLSHNHILGSQRIYT